MRIRSMSNFKALTLILSAIFLAEKLASGDLFYYVHPQHGWLIVLAICLLILMGASYRRHNISRQTDQREDAASSVSLAPIATLAVLLLVAIAMPIHQFGAVDVSNNALFMQRRHSEILISLEKQDALPAEISPTQANATSIRTSLSQTINLTGFVYHDPLLEKSQFVLVRYILPCCAMNALALGVIVQTSQSIDYESDSWVQVEGVLDAHMLAGNHTHVLYAHTIQPIEPPSPLYLFP